MYIRLRQLISKKTVTGIMLEHKVRPMMVLSVETVLLWLRLPVLHQLLPNLYMHHVLHLEWALPMPRLPLIITYQVIFQVELGHHRRFCLQRVQIPRKVLTSSKVMYQELDMPLPDGIRTLLLVPDMQVPLVRIPVLICMDSIQSCMEI